MMENLAVLTIATIFLGLVAGPQSVELVAGAEIARVELAVGGRRCAELTAPPWRATCDFGPTPAPLRLTAVGFGSDGRELHRTERVVNRLRAAAEVDLHLERTPSGSLRARLVADSLAPGAPRSIRVELDGAALAAPDPAAIELPPVDLDVPHLLRAELDWTDTVSAAGELVFGGRHGEAISSELTAVAIEAPRKLDLARLDGALVGAGGALRAVAIDQGPAELFVVLDREAISPLARVASIAARVPADGSGFGRPGGDRQRGALGGANQRYLFALERDDRIRIVWPWPERRQDEGRMIASFPPSPPYTTRDGGLVWVLTHARLPAGRAETPALVDAAAVAGMVADGRERRRAVLVVLGPRDEDASRLDAAGLRAYLTSVRVPLFVWRAAKRTGTGPDPWGEVEALGSSAALQRAFRALEESLARQRIVWLEGAHLPNEIRLAAARDDLRLAGASAR